MSVSLSMFAGAGAQFFDNNGVPLSGGKIYTYAAGTTTPLVTYTSASNSAFHTNPIILDSAGRIPSGGEIWLDVGQGYKFVVKTTNDVLIATYDNIPSAAQPPDGNDADSILYEEGYIVTAGNFIAGKIYRILSVGTTNFTSIGATSNTSGLHFIATGAGSGTGNAELSQTVETKLQQYISVKDFGAVGDGVTDDYVAFQAAYDNVNANATIFIPAGTYKCSTMLTFSGTKRVHWVTNTDTRWVTSADLTNVFVESFNTATANYWRSHEYFADNNEGAGGLLQTYLVRESTNNASGYQWDGHRIHLIHKDTSSVGVSKGAIGQSIFAYVDASNSYGQLWCQNLYVRVSPGGDGVLRGSETNLDNNGTVVKEVGAQYNKLGSLITTKALAGTAGSVVGKGAGDGWYKGFIVLGDAIVSDTDARAFEYTDFFEVMSDGTVLVGKGANQIFTVGVTITPTGQVNATATGGVSLLTLNRTETLSVSTDIGQITGRALNSAGASKNFANIILTASDPTSTTEAGKIAFQTYVAGTLATRASIKQGLVVGLPTGDDKGIGTINVSAGVYLNGTAFTNPDYVFEKAYTGKIEKFADKLGADSYQPKTIDEAEQYTKENLALPGFGQTAELDYLGGSEMLLARLEEAYLYIFELNKRLKDLENK
jgi:hypothetical protein